MTVSHSFTRTYPRTVALDKGSINLRLMEASDGDAILAFAQGLPPDDLLFLRLDITKPDGVAEWVRNIEAGRTITILAEDAGSIAGYASIHHNEVLWSRHVGDPILESNITRRVDFALFMVEALENDDLVHEAPAIVGCQTPSALAHAVVIKDTG